MSESNRPLLLIVDDDVSTLARMRQILAEDYRLVFARGGEDALAAARKHQPALILLDVEMPDMDGYAVCRQLKQIPETQAIPVVFITSHGKSGEEELGFEAGGVDYLIKPVVPAIVRVRVQTHLSLVRAEELEQSYREAIYMLGDAGHFNDDDTGQHIWRMAEYVRILAEELGWDRASANLLSMAAPMHDTGKIGISDKILRKPGPLTPDEAEIMKTHTIIGHKILSKSHAPIFKLAASIALNHHERWDGTGYPQGLAGEAIPESARIVAVADVYDALTMMRPFKQKWPAELAIAEIRNMAGSHFEPRIVDAFERALPRILSVQAYWDTTSVVGG